MMSRREALCVAKSYSDGFLVCRALFACVTDDFSVFVMSLKRPIAISFLLKIEIIAVWLNLVRSDNGR